MRLTKFEIDSIRKSFHKIFGQSAKICLFGSRVDDSLKGGDIDLYIQAPDITSPLTKKIDFLVDLKSQIGDQKIDVIISKDTSRLIENEAINKGVFL